MILLNLQYVIPRISEVKELQFPLLLANYKVTTLLTSGISQPVPLYNGELWALHSGPISIPIPVTLNLKIP